MVFFEDETGFEGDFPAKELASEVAGHILKKENCPYPYEINVLLTDGNTIKNLNRDFRGRDEVTDVLSFPNVEFPKPADFQMLEDKAEWADCFDPENDCLVLGDMVICAERMVKQAEEYGHSVKREFAFLVAHSTLHLIGYDHIKPEDAGIMEQKQKDYLKELGIER